MAATAIRGGQIQDGTVQRVDVDVSTIGQALIRKVIQGTGITISSTGSDSGTGDVTINASGGGGNVSNVGTPANGQMAQWTGANTIQGITALAARGSGGINSESRSTFTNANYTGLATDRYIATTATVFTASRTVTLPAANALNAGALIYIGDDGAAITSAFQLIIARAGTDTIHAGTASLTLYVPRASVILETDGVSNWTVMSRSPAVRIQAFSSGTTFTTTVGCKAMFVECIGGGGGGGGAVSSASNAAAGGGGAGGSYASTYIIAPKASYTYAVGGGGAAGTTAGGSGGAGGTTSFDTGPSVVSASGGNGGAGLATGAATGGVVAAGGSATSVFIGDIQTIGSDGFPGTRWTGTTALGGNGGAAAGGGGGGIRGSVGQADGRAGSQYGGGGSGAVSLNATGQAGGAGAFGVIVITEFF